MAKSPLHSLLFTMSECEGDWPRYLERLYQFFEQDFKSTANPLHFKGRAVKLIHAPLIDGKEITFWHLISAGKVELDRTPDLRRCERIKWPRQIIEQAETNSAKVWENRRRREKRTCILLEGERFLIVLGNRSSYYVLCTAYPIENHTLRKLLKEYEEYKKTGTAS